MILFPNNLLRRDPEECLGLGAQVQILGPAFGVKPGLNDGPRGGGDDGLKPLLGPFSFSHFPGQAPIPEQNEGQNTSDDRCNDNPHFDQKSSGCSIREAHVDPAVGDLFTFRFRDGL